MTIRDLRGTVKDKIPVRTVLLSVFDKSGLETFIPELLEISPDVLLLSTGGTYKAIEKMLGAKSGQYLMEVAQYTGFPEMEGGLVKTLHPKIHAGLLAERNNPAHQEYLTQMHARFIDMVVVNLYPFSQVVADPNVSFEKARGNIDIGGPTMLRAAAKNFPSCAAVCDPTDYRSLLSAIKVNDGCTNFDMRRFLATKVFEKTSEYDTAIRDFLRSQFSTSVRENYTFEKQE